MALKKQGSTKRIERATTTGQTVETSPNKKPAAKRRATPNPSEPAFRQSQVDTRRAYYAHEMPEELRAAFEKEFEGEPTPHLDHLLD